MILTVFVVGLAVLMGIGAAALWTVHEYADAAQWRAEVSNVRGDIADIEILVRDAETGQRGFLLTGDETYLAPYRTVQQRLAAEMDDLLSASAIPAVQEKAKLLQDTVQRKMDELQKTIELRTAGKSEEALTMVRTARGQKLMDEIRTRLEEMTQDEATAVRLRDQKMQAYGTLCKFVVLLGLIAAFGFGTYALRAILQEMAQRRVAGSALIEAKAQLEHRVADLDQRNREIELLSEMANQLQACQSAEEAYTAISLFAGQIFPLAPGAVYVYNPSRDNVELRASWGGKATTNEVFSPQDCWALRRGQIYHVNASHRGVRCKHALDNGASYSCVPMLAQGDPVGMLYIEYADAAPNAGIAEWLERVATSIADQVALSLVNLKLRETLRGQSIRDPLTHLFNRRYMEESLEREIKRALRSQHSLSAIMLDLDHFKHLNDTYGHEAGDLVLKAVSSLLKSKTRGEDIVCRYGGEELTIIMPDAPLEDAAARAQFLCDEIHALRVRHLAAVIEVTASLGVAACPQHGTSSDHVLRAADLALYRAKQKGRNCVVVADLAASALLGDVQA